MTTTAPDGKTYEEKMLDYGVERGWLAPGDRLDQLTASQYQEAAKKVRPRRELVRDGTRAVTSRAMTSMGVRNVSEQRAAENEAKCRACPHGKFITLRNGEPACNQCNCSNKYLKSKWKDQLEFCPKGEWDNRVTLTVSAGGDSNVAGGG